MESQEINVKQVPATLEVNFDELRTALEADLERYDIVVTQDTVKDAKKTATELNKRKQAIARKRIDAVKEVSKPIREFEDQMKQLEGMHDDARSRILTQVEKYEAQTLAEARALLEDLRAEQWEAQGVQFEFRRASIEDLVKLSSVTDSGKLAKASRETLLSRVAEDLSLQRETELRLARLESESYRAGLDAPLERAHVESFLFADAETYDAKLNGLIETELRRQEQARARERQRQEREAEAQAEAEAEAERRRAKAEPEVESPAQEEPPDPETAAEPEPPAEPKPDDDGRVECVATAVFRSRVKAGVSKVQIEAELRRVLEKAGITSLDRVDVELR